MDETNYSKTCDACSKGGQCEQPYTALDGTTYWCTKIIPHLDN